MTRIDHVALEIAHLDEQLALLTEHLGLRIIREGRRYSTGPRIVMVTDDQGFKLELIEATSDSDGGDGTEMFEHLAVRADDVSATHTDLLASGATEQRPPHRLDAARADSSLVRLGDLSDQVIRYDPDSPDLT